MAEQSKTRRISDYHSPIRVEQRSGWQKERDIRRWRGKVLENGLEAALDDEFGYRRDMAGKPPCDLPARLPFCILCHFSRLHKRWNRTSTLLFLRSQQIHHCLIFLPAFNRLFTRLTLLYLTLFFLLDFVFLLDFARRTISFITFWQRKICPFWEPHPDICTIQSPVPSLFAFIKDCGQIQ